MGGTRANLAGAMTSPKVRVVEASMTDRDALKRELELIQRQAYITQQARAYRLGGGREIAFTLDANAPALPADAPGSASVKLGAAPMDQRTPLESWLELLFGPAG